MNSYLIGSIGRGLKKRAPAVGLGLFRVFFGVVILQEIAFLIYFRHLIFDQVPYIETAGPIVTFSLLIWLGVAVCLIFGLFTFFCSIANYLFWVLFVLLTPMWRDFDGGFDQLITSSSFILIFIHSERRFSLDNLRDKLKYSAGLPVLSPDTRVPVIYYYVLIGVSLGLLYLDAALHKLHSEIWINGLGAWVPNTMPYYMSSFDFDWFVNARRLQELIGYSLIAFQLSFIFLFTHRLFRAPLLVFGVLFHLGIIFYLNIYPYGFGMLVHYILLVPFRWWTRAARTIEHKNSLLCTYCNNNDRKSVRLALILQHFDFRKYSTFHFVSDAYELPEIIRKKHPDFRSFTIASWDRGNKIYEGNTGFVEEKYFRSLLFILQLTDITRSLITRSLAYCRVGQTRFANHSNRNQTSPSRFISRERTPDADISSKSIYRFLAVVLVLQVNSTLYYAVFQKFSINERATVYGKIISEISVYVTSISHILLGITPHALYMDDHFGGYEHISALAYIDSSGKEKWVPFIGSDGRFLLPNWGRVHSMWANVAMHPPINQLVFERLAKKVTAFWAEKLGIGTQDSTFIIKTKPVQISYRWLDGLRKKNLREKWSEFGRIRWTNGQFSIHYRS